jgi:chemotaxis protein methyltransferase CheR
VKSSSIEYESLLEQLLTQETSFFRYPAVYEALEKKIIPEIEERKFWENPRVLRIWSAGCSTGEEPYSIAITLCEALKFAEAWEIEVLATDISRRALRHAERGAYRNRTLQDVDPRRADESDRAGVRGKSGLHLLHERTDVFFGAAPQGHSAAFL